MLDAAVNEHPLTHVLSDKPTVRDITSVLQYSLLGRPDPSHISPAIPQNMILSQEAAQLPPQVASQSPKHCHCALSWPRRLSWQ